MSGNKRLKLTLTRHQALTVAAEAKRRASTAESDRDRITWTGIAREAQKAVDWNDQRTSQTDGSEQ